jgi:nucleoside phosphorylase
MALPDRIAITAAMENELGFLRKAMTPAPHPRERYAVGTIGPKTVMVLRTGVGPRKTTRRLSEAEWSETPQCMLSIGCAGALSDTLRIGDAIIADKIVTDSPGTPVFAPAAELMQTARNCCEKLNTRFHTGTTVSASTVAATTEDKTSLATEYGALAVDMESGQVAAWAENAGIPLLAIRTISDALADSIPPEAASLVDPQGKLVPRRIVSLAISSPSLFLSIFRLKRNLDFSLRMLEKIVMALLREP